MGEYKKIIINQGNGMTGKTYLAVAFSSFGAIDPPSRILLDRALKSAFPSDVVSLGMSRSGMSFGALLMEPRLEAVKDSNTNPATTMAIRTVMCRAIMNKKQRRAQVSGRVG